MWQFGARSSYYPCGVSLYPFMVGQQGIRKRKFNSSVFNMWLGKFVKRIFLQAQTLLANLSFILSPQHDRPTHKCLFYSSYIHRKGIFLGSLCFGTIFSCTHILQHHLNSHHITPQIKWLFLFKEYKLNQDLELSFDSFKLVFQHMLHLSTNGSYGMVF